MGWQWEGWKVEGCFPGKTGGGERGGGLAGTGQAVCGRSAEGERGRGRDETAPPGTVARRGRAGQSGGVSAGGWDGGGFWFWLTFFLLDPVKQAERGFAGRGHPFG